MSYLPPHALAFRDLFARVEHTLRREGYVQAGRAKSMVDWQQFAADLGEQFFINVRDSGSALTLVQEPPRALHNDGTWQPQNPTPITTVRELMLGVCQIRHNIEHGEKYMLPE